MSLLRDSWWTVAAFFSAVFCVVADAGTATAQTLRQGYRQQSETASRPALSEAQRKKMADEFERKLGRMRPTGSRIKDVNDFYMLGTAELRLADRHADVCFNVMQGQKEVAEYLVGYVVDHPEQTLRSWHVFGRFKDAEKAEEALKFARAQYDQALAYRERIAGIYGAQSTRRC